MISQAVFACYSKACAPPPAGKGGSIPAQHVTGQHNSGSIMRSGFTTDKIGSGAGGQTHGDGFYFSKAGDTESEKFYSRMYDSPRVIKARLKLDNPLTVSGKSLGELRENITAKLGGTDVTLDAVGKFDREYRKAYRDLAVKHLQSDNPDAFRALWGKHHGEPNQGMLWDFSQDAVTTFEAAFKSRYGRNHEWHFRAAQKVLKDPSKLGAPKRGEYDDHSDVNALLGLMVKRAGHDALIIEATGRDHRVGGSQVVVFNPGKIRVTRPIP